MMESRRLECLLDSTVLFRARLDDIHQQQHRLFMESITIMVAQADLPVSISSVKRREGATRYFQTNEAEQCRDMDGKENTVPGDTLVRGPQLKSCKASAAKTRKRRKPLVDSQAVNQAGQLDATSICTRVVDGGEPDEDMLFQQEKGGNEELVHSMEENKSTSLSVRGSEELFHSIEENNKSTSKSVSPRRSTLAREAEESVPNLGNPRASRAAVSIGGKASQVKTEVGDVKAPILTRARARILQNVGGNVTMARGEPPLKKRRRRKGNSNSMCINPPAENDETAGKAQNITPLEQQSKEGPPSKRSVAVKTRNTRANSQSLAVETNENMGQNGAIGEEQDTKVVRPENVPPNTSRTAEEEEENVGVGRASKKSRTSLGNARPKSCSQAELDAFELGKPEGAKATEYFLSKALASVEDCNSTGGSSIKRPGEQYRNAALGEMDGNLGEFETVVTNQNESMHCTVAHRPWTKSPSTKEGIVVAAPSCPLHSDVSSCTFISKGGASHSMDERDGTDSTQADDMVMPSAQNGSASEVRIPCSSPKIIEVEVANFDSVNALTVDRGHSYCGTELPSDCLVSTEDPLKRNLSRERESLEDSADTGSKPNSVVSSPPQGNQFEADIIVLDHSELKDEDTSSIFELPAEEYQVEEEDRPLTEGHPRIRFPDSLPETDENPDRTRRIVGHSVRVHCLAVELDRNETTMDAIGAESADVQSSVLGQATERIDDKADGMHLWCVENSLEVSISPRDRDCNIVDQGEFRSSPGAVLEPPESIDVREGKDLPGQLPQTQVTHGNSTGTPVRIERRLTEPTTTPEEIHGEEVEDEGTGAVVFGSLQLKFNEENHLLENSAIGNTHRGLNSRTTLNVSDQEDERAGDLRLVMPLDQNVNPSVEQESTKETAGGLQNSQMNVSRVNSPVEKWDRKRLLEVGANKSLVAVLSSVGRANSASVNDHHRADEVGVQRYTDRSRELRESELCGEKLSVDGFPEREGCVRSPPVKDSKEVGTFVTLLKQASEPSKALGRLRMEGSAPIDYAPPPFTNAQYGSELRLSRLMSTKHVGLSFTVADAPGEDSKFYSRPVEAGRLYEGLEGLVSGSGIKENGQEPEWTCNKLELVDGGANKSMPFSTDESCVSLQNKKTTDLLLKLWKRGGFRKSCLTVREGPSSSESPGSNYTVDVIDEVYRSVVVRECGGNGAASSLTLPAGNWRSGIVHNMIGAAPQSGARLMERGLPLSDGPMVREVTEVDFPEDRKFGHEEEMKPPSVLIQEQEPYAQYFVSAFANSEVVECSQETDNDCEVSLESEQLLSHEELNTSKPIPLSRVEEEPEVSSHDDRPEDDVAVPADSPSCKPVGSVDSLQQVVSSKNGNAQLKLSSNLVANVKSFVPVIQQPPPSFMPDGNRVVKVKALIAAEAVRKAEENGDVKDGRLRKMRRVEEKATCRLEKDEAVKARSIPLKESVDGGESSCGSQMSPKRKVLLRDHFSSRNLFSPETKSKQTTNLENEKKVKKNLAELKRIEEERKLKLLAMRQNKEELAKMNRQRQEVLKVRKDQNRLVEHEGKGQRHQIPEEAEREKKEMEEKSKLCTPKSRDKENRVGEELKVKGARHVLQVAGQARPGQTPAKIRSNLLGPGTLSLQSAGRVPVILKDRRTPVIVAGRLEKKGRRQSPSSSSSRCSEAVENGEDLGPMSYEMSPYRESDDEEDEEEQQAKKIIPFWARKDNLNRHLLKHLTLDPDEIFSGSKTCSLKEVFGTTGSMKVQDFGKRSGSGDWLRDRVSWREELQYKINMGYVPQTYPS